jgi:hypothetical protein
LEIKFINQKIYTTTLNEKEYNLTYWCKLYVYLWDKFWLFEIKIKIYASFQIKCASLKILECNIETNVHYVQFIWLVSPISFQLDVQIGCIFYGFKSQVEYYSYSNLNIYIYVNIPNTCSTIYIYINMH